MVDKVPLGGMKRHDEINISYSDKELVTSNNLDLLPYDSHLVTMTPIVAWKEVKRKREKKDKLRIIY